MSLSMRKVAASLAGEYALALLWPLSTVLYALLPPILATIVGALLVWPLCVYAILTACPPKMPPRLSPALILLDIFYLPMSRVRGHRETLYRTETAFWSLLRLVLHWLGGFSGFYLLNLCFGQETRLATETGLSTVWTLLGKFAGPDPGTRQGNGNALYLFVLHVALQGIIGGFQMRFFAEVQSSFTPSSSSSFKWLAAFASVLGYPWAAPHFSIGSFLWIVHAAGLSSLTLMTASILACPLSALVAALFYETTKRPSPLQEKERNTNIDELD